MEKEIELLDVAPGALPGLNAGDLFRYLPVLIKLVEAFVSGQGEFITKTPFGRKRVKIEDA